MKLDRHLAAALALAAACTFPAVAQTAVPPKAGAPAVAASAQKSATSGAVTLDHCEKQAGDRTGDAKKSFLKSCLKPVSTQQQGTQQGKMKQCNVDAKGKKGDERRAFMSECLKKKKP